MKIQRLEKGMTLALLAPSSPMDPQGEVALRGERYLENLGFKLKKYQSFTTPAEGYLSSTDEVRAHELMDAFSDPEVKGIICVRGGYGATRLLDKLDYSVIKKNPKFFTGYSDITVLLNAFYAKAGLVTVHGPMLCSFGSQNWDAWSDNDFHALLEEKQLGRVITSPHGVAHALVEGIVEAPIVGGNLSLIANLQGTPWAIDAHNKILFLEEVDEAPYSLDRYLSNLRLSGLLDHASAIILGYFSQTKGDPDGKETKRILEEFFKDFKKPVLAGFASGHEYPFASLPIGIKVRLDTTNGTITLLEDLYE